MIAGIFIMCAALLITIAGIALGSLPLVITAAVVQVIGIIVGYRDAVR